MNRGSLLQSLVLKIGVGVTFALGLANIGFAQTATNSASVAPPGGITNSGTSCVAPASFTAATGVCTATDSDTIIYPVQVTKVVTGGPATGAPGTYTFTITCATPAQTYNGSITIAAGSSTGSTTVNIPGGSTNCQVAETAPLPTAPTNYTWGALSTVVYEQPATPIAASATAKITNTLTADPGTITLTKTVAGAPAGGAGGGYDYSLVCSSGTYTGTITVVAGATTGSATVTGVPAGATCSALTETSKAGAPANYTWGTETTVVPSGTMGAGGTLSGSITNPLTRNQATLTVTKDVIGAPAAGAPGTYGFSVSCSNPTATYNGSVVLSGTTTNGTGTVDVPEGSTNCVVAETMKPVAPINYAWGVESYAQPASPLMPGATATITNPLILQTTAITKTVTSTGPYTLGSVISYSVTATNTGTVTQANVVVTDSKLNPSTTTCASVAPNGTCVLTGSYTVTQADVDAGKVDNTATVVSDTVTTPVTTPVVTTPVAQAPALTIVKSADKASFSTLGEVITYTYVITNTGNLTLAGPFTVNDDKIGALADCAAGPLVPGASARCTATYAITRADLDAGSVTNLASVTGNGVTSPQVSVTIVEQATPISVVDNDFGAIDGVTGGTTDSVLGNDTLGGQPVTVGTVALTPGTSPDPGLVMNPDGTITVAPNTPVGSYQYPYTLCERANPSNCGTAIATVVVEARTTSMRVTKTATPRDVEVGGLVRYTLLIENTGAYAVADASVIDTPPAGFSYVDGSMTVADADNAGRLVGTNPLAIDRIDIAVGGRATVTYMMRVGAGVRPGGYVNRAKMVDNGRDASNVASAEVQVKSDPMLDDSLIAGTVWDDRDGDGWQDSAAVTGLKVQGGFAPSAYVANSTTVDRGNGPQPEADASSPMLHGIALGSLAGRQSDADPASSHAIVIRQTLSSLAFTDDFVLGNDQGYTVRMNAAGQTSVERTGDAAKGLNGAELQVERTVAQVGNGYQVDYIVRSTGVDERGIPGVRIASVEGLVVETDQFGRYHIAGIAGGPQERGRNFILKVDPATLPPGSTMTTDNPLLRRVTPGLPVRFDFGVKLPKAVIEGGRKDVELELGEVIFAPGKADIQAQYDAVVERMAAEVRRHGGGEVMIRADGDSQGLAYERASAVQAKLLAALDPASASALKVTLRTEVANPDTTVLTLGETPVLGTFLFDTDKATIKPGFGPLLDRIAKTIDERAAAGGKTVIAVVGHADRRGSRDYNQALGLRRAKAVYEAIAARLGAPAKARLRVDIDDNLASPTGLRDDGR